MAVVLGLVNFPNFAVPSGLVVSPAICGSAVYPRNPLRHAKDLERPFYEDIIVIARFFAGQNQAEDDLQIHAN